MTTSYTAREGTDAVVQDWDGAIIGPENEDAWTAYQDWLAAGGVTSPAIPVTPFVPQIISDRQFFQQAAVLGVITQAEALAAVQTGAIPAILQTVVDGIADPDQKFAATMLLSGATIFERYHPFTNAVGAALGWTPDQVDQFFVAASKL